MRRFAIRKAQPTGSTLHINTPLTFLSIAFMQSAEGFVSDKVFPIIPVTHQSDQFYKYAREDFLRPQARRRAPASESAGGGFQISTGQYSTAVFGFHKDVADQDRNNADSILQLDQSATNFVSQQLMLQREIDWVSAFFKTGVWATDTTPAALWSAAGSDPAKDLEVGKLKIASFGVGKANTLVLGAEVKSALRYNTAIRDQFKYTSADSIDDAMIARYFGVDRVFEASAIMVATPEGGAAPASQFIAGKHALLCHVPRAPGIMTPAAGYIWAWTGVGGNGFGTAISRFRMEHLKSDRVEGEMAYGMNVIAPELGYFLHDIVA